MTLNDKRTTLLESLETAHANYYTSAVFGGPSLHFHLQAIGAARHSNSSLFSEYVYAALTAWGMHRMGPGGSKMTDFQEFSKSIALVWPKLAGLRDRQPTELNESDWNDLKYAFLNLRCMRSKTALVGHSKVMAHALPNLISPIDRQYTLKFLFGKTDIKNDIEHEWSRLKQIHTEFFYPIVSKDTFAQKAKQWMGQQETFRWDTSPMKIVDNLIIGIVKSESSPKSKSESKRHRRVLNQSSSAGLMPKYERLSRHLAELPRSTSTCSLSFKKIEEIIDSTLPDSAYKYREWWSNQTDTANRPQAKAWTSAGFRVDSVSQGKSGASVVFARNA